MSESNTPELAWLWAVSRELDELGFDFDSRREAGAQLAETLFRQKDVDRALLLGLALTLSELLQSGPLGRAVGRWHLSPEDVGRRFGVPPEEAEGWLVGVMPMEHREEIDTLLAATEILSRYLRPGAIPEVVRRRATALGGRSLIELWVEEGADAVLRSVQKMFDFSRAAG